MSRSQGNAGLLQDALEQGLDRHALEFGIRAKAQSVPPRGQQHRLNVVRSDGRRPTEPRPRFCGRQQRRRGARARAELHGWALAGGLGEIHDVGQDVIGGGESARLPARVG